MTRKKDKIVKNIKKWTVKLYLLHITHEDYKTDVICRNSSANIGTADQSDVRHEEHTAIANSYISNFS